MRRFNDLPPIHKLGWIQAAELIYKDMTSTKFLELLTEHNPEVIVYSNGECSTWLDDETRIEFMKKTKIELKL